MLLKLHKNCNKTQEKCKKILKNESSRKNFVKNIKSFLKL